MRGLICSESAQREFIASVQKVGRRAKFQGGDKNRMACCVRAHELGTILVGSFMATDNSLCME
jgi:hypothetical protein